MNHIGKRIYDHNDDKYSKNRDKSPIPTKLHKEQHVNNPKEVSDMEIQSETLLRMFPDKKSDILLLILKGCDYDITAAIDLLKNCRTPSSHHPVTYQQPSRTAPYLPRYPRDVPRENSAFQRINCRTCQTHH